MYPFCIYLSTNQSCMFIVWIWLANGAIVTQCGKSGILYWKLFSGKFSDCFMVLFSWIQCHHHFQHQQIKKFPENSNSTLHSPLNPKFSRNPTLFFVWTYRPHRFTNSPHCVINRRHPVFVYNFTFLDITVEYSHISCIRCNFVWYTSCKHTDYMSMDSDFQENFVFRQVYSRSWSKQSGAV